MCGGSMKRNPIHGPVRDLTPDNCCFDHWLTQEKCADCDAKQCERERNKGVQMRLFEPVKTWKCIHCGQSADRWLCDVCVGRWNTV